MIDFRCVYQSEIVSIHRWKCDGKAESQRTVPANGFVFTQHGVFRKCSGREGPVVATPGSVLFTRGAEQIRVTHPVAGGDGGVVVRPVDGVLAGITEGQARERDPVEEMESSSALASSISTLRLRGLLALLDEGEVSSLDVDETALDIVSSALEVLCSRPDSTARTPATRRAHREAVERVKVLVSDRYREPLTLAEIAGETCYSVFHLCRMFKAHTGVSVHRYVNRVRLVAALEILARRARVTEAAFQVGFSSPSHFSDAFQKEFRVRPVEVRRYLADPRDATRQLLNTL